MQYPIYPETSGGDLILKRDDGDTKSVVCQRIMMHRIKPCPKTKISSPQDAIDLMKEMQDYDREHAVILHLDTKNKVIGIENISTGSLTASIVHPREAIKGAVLNNAANAIFIHNHPSGDTGPSNEDMEITKILQNAFNSVGMVLLDSIIIGKNGYHSFR